MSDFDNVKLDDWVRIEQDFPKEAARLPYTLVYEGIVTDRDARAGLLRLSSGEDAFVSWVATTTGRDDVTVRLVEHLPYRGVGWHEVARPEGDVAVRWWDGDEWRHGPTGPRALQYGRSEYYLGTGSSR